MSSILPKVALGDATAVDACLRQYGGMVWSITSQYLAGRPQDVEDAVQEIFVDVWLSAHRFDPAKGTEPGFIATIAHRRLIDRRRRFTPRFEAGSPNAASVASGPLPSDDDGLHVRHAMRQLSADELQTLHLAVGRGLSHREIAVATDVPVGTVKTRLRRAISRLQEVIGAASARSHGGVA